MASEGDELVPVMNQFDGGVVLNEVCVLVGLSHVGKFTLQQ